MADDIRKALRGKSWEEIEALEHEGRVLFPDSIRFRARDGSVTEVAILVRALRNHERRKARVEARDRAKQDGLDLDRDADLCATLDRLYQLARAIREVKEPHEQHATAEMLEQNYDGRSLDELWSRYEVYCDRSDPRIEITDEAQLWAALGEVARVGNILPLTGLESFSQNGCIVFGARQALLSPTFKSFLDSIDRSTPGS